MNDLLSVAVSAHGGLSRWHQLKTVKAQGFSGCRTPEQRTELAKKAVQTRWVKAKKKNKRLGKAPRE
jgi:hypothetical protein